MPNHKSFYEEYWRERMALDRSHDTGRSRRIDLACSRVAAGDQVLDFGCGIGDFTVPLLEAGALVSAVDVSERAVERARKRAPAADFGVVVPGHDLTGLWPWKSSSTSLTPTGCFRSFDAC